MNLPSAFPSAPIRDAEKTTIRTKRRTITSPTRSIDTPCSMLKGGASGLRHRSCSSLVTAAPAPMRRKTPWPPSRRPNVRALMASSLTQCCAAAERWWSATTSGWIDWLGYPGWFATRRSGSCSKRTSDRTLASSRLEFPRWWKCSARCPHTFWSISSSSARTLTTTVFLVDPDRPYFVQANVLAPLVSSHSVHFFYQSCTPERVARWRNRGIEVAAWTVDDPQTSLALQQMGVRYCITNRPALIRERGRTV